MRFRNLSGLRRSEPREIALATLPQDIAMAHYARAKAFKINELVRTIHESSFEWYGFTLAASQHPEIIIDIGLPQNSRNLHDYTTIDPTRIAEFQEELPKEKIINGWIHSHGALNYQHFSHTDEKNHLVVLDFVAAATRRAVAKKEVAIKDLVFLVQDQFFEEHLTDGSVCLITDVPITAAKIMETIYGSFCYAIVIGDEGWHEQEIYYKRNGVLTGHTALSHKKAEIVLADSGRQLSQIDIDALSDEVRKKIQPNLNPPPEIIERM